MPRHSAANKKAEGRFDVAAAKEKEECRSSITATEKKERLPLPPLRMRRKRERRRSAVLHTAPPPPTLRRRIAPPVPAYAFAREGALPPPSSMLARVGDRPPFWCFLFVRCLFFKGGISTSLRCLIITLAKQQASQFE